MLHPQPTRSLSAPLLALALGLVLGLVACSEPAEEGTPKPAPNAHTNNTTSNNAHTNNTTSNTNNTTSNNASACPSPNACGGCEPLEGTPGSPCGRCGQGALVCNGHNALACQGDSDTCPREDDHCADGQDNDGDGLSDCDDDDCQRSPLCLDDDCADVDLGSALGRPVTDIRAVGRGNDLEDECLTDAEDVVFKWTAPYDGVFAFDATLLNAQNTALPVPLQVRTGGCASTRAWCGLHHVNYRSSVSLSLRQGDIVVIATEEAATLGIKPGEIPLASAGLSFGSGPRSYLRVTPDLTGDGWAELLLGPSSHAAAVLRLLPLDTPEPSLRNHAPFPFYDYQVVATDFGGQENPMPFTADFDLNEDGTLDLYVLTLAESGERLLHAGPPDWEGGRWHATPVPSGPWRPAGAWGDLTGDDAPDLVSWSPERTRWEIYDDARRAWRADQHPLAVLDAHVNHQGDVGRPAAVCDFDGDGFNDLLVDSSTLLLVPGPMTAASDLNATAVSLGALSARPSSFPGQDIFVTGDLNADGRCDVILHRPPTLSSPGEVTLFFGPLDRPLTAENAAQRFVDDPTRALRGVGAAVAAGDVNGDGITDLLVGAPETHRELPSQERSSAGGLVFLFFGPLDPTEPLDLFAADRILTAYKESLDCCSPTTFGHLLAAGDLDGDGMDEVIVFDASDDHELSIFSGARITAGQFGREIQP